MALMNRLNARSVATLGAGKYNDGAGLLLHKRKDGGAQWIYCYTIYGCCHKWAWERCEMSL